MPSGPPVLLSFSLHDDAGSSQLAGTVFVKTEGAHALGRVAAAFCRWIALPVEACRFFSGPTQLDLRLTVDQAGLVMSSPVVVYISKDGPAPSAAALAAPYTIVDVVDSEMASMMGGSLEMAS